VPRFINLSLRCPILGGIIKRGTDSEKRIEIRLQRFQQEMEYKDRFDHVMINEDLDVAKTELIEIVNELKEGVLNGT
jgi:guanylate kinase